MLKRGSQQTDAARCIFIFIVSAYEATRAAGCTMGERVRRACACACAACHYHYPDHHHHHDHAEKVQHANIKTCIGVLIHSFLLFDTNWTGPTAGPRETTVGRATANRAVSPAGSFINYTNLQPPTHQVTTGSVQHVSAERFDRQRRTEEDDVLFYNSNL